MPRTKVTKKSSKKSDDEIDRQMILKEFNAATQETIDHSKSVMYKCLEENRAELYTQFTSEILNTKWGDLNKLTTLMGNSTVSINMSRKDDILSHTKSFKKGKKQVTRSSSLTDEGYLTTESSNSVGRISSHQSRVKSQKVLGKTNRTTRSLSRNNQLQVKSNHITPLNNNMKQHNYGLVTPKCKPNTPQILLRRPKTGEVALSFQGSPLLTAAVVTDEVANINIPLNDGTLLSLQPQAGLRLSQIPTFDSTTLRQLETLNEHLQMMLGAANLHK